jgi:regulator of sigma E protease
MQILLTIISFLFGLGFLIAIHEFGHYFIAKLCNVKVLRFSLGFGKPLWSRRLGSDQTEWVVATWPLGGYVKMLDERESAVEVTEVDRAFNRKAVWQKFLIVLAGPVANLALAIILYMSLFLNGVPELTAKIGDPLPNTPAAHAGFKTEDVVKTVNDIAIQSWQDFRWAILELALQKQEASVGVTNADGIHQYKKVDLSGLTEQEFDKDVLVQLGFNRFRIDVPAIIGQVNPRSPAEVSGLLPGDKIVRINDSSISAWQDVVKIIRESPDQRLQFELERTGGVQLIQITPEMISTRGETYGRIGAGPLIDQKILSSDTIIVSYDMSESAKKAFLKTYQTAIFSLRMMGKMISGEISLRNLSGPVTIADYAGQSAQQGWIPYIMFLALVSISLGVLNLLPIPLLDGGHLMYYLFEFLSGKPVPENIIEASQKIGLMVLILLMSLSLFNDINRLIGY